MLPESRMGLILEYEMSDSAPKAFCVNPVRPTKPINELQLML
jgi:hypothetical protein